MNPTDRTPIILACVDDILRECAGDDIERLTVALQISTDLNAVVRLWPPTEEDQAIADWIVECARGREPADHRRFEPAALAGLSMVAAHLAAVSASLLVRGEAWADEARTLWHAASRLLGHDTTTKETRLDRESTEMLVGVANLTAKTPGMSVMATPNGLRFEAPPPTPTADPDTADELERWRRWARLRHSADADRDDIGMRAHVDLLVFKASKLERKLDDWRRWAVTKTGTDPTGVDSFLRMAVNVNATAEVKRITREHADEIARLTDALATARADLEEAQRSPVSAGPTTAEVEAAVTQTIQRSAVTPSHHHRSSAISKSAALVTDIRKAALAAGAKDCTVFVGPEDSDLTVVVDLPETISLYTIRAALNMTLPPDMRYTLREVGHAITNASTSSECRQCGCPPPTLQRYACGLCGYPTPEGDANAGRSPQYPIDPEVRPALAHLVAKRRAENASNG